VTYIIVNGRQYDSPDEVMREVGVTIASGGAWAPGDTIRFDITEPVRDFPELNPRRPMNRLARRRAAALARRRA